jgi:hypothetical protein
MEDNMVDDTVAFEADREWIDAHIDILVQQYADYWIAVRNRRVIASEADLGALLGKVPDLAHTCVEFVSRQRPAQPL